MQKVDEGTEILREKKLILLGPFDNAGFTGRVEG
jgi:hypothetical protein